jgi:phenylalanyl-tRNA synthetase alpha subunit
MYELEKMREFATREKAIISDGRLSQDGRYEAIKKLNDEKLQYKPVAVAGLKATAEQIKKEFKQAGKNINDAIEKRDASWNFNKLNYHAQAPGITAGAFRKYRSYSGDDHCYFTA